MRKVLIVDDDIDIRRLLGSLLTRHGFQVTLAKSYGWGILLGKAQAHDIAIADVHLGAVFDGIQMSQQLVHQHPSTRVIIITGAPTDELKARAEASGFPILEKPLDPKEILSLVTQFAEEQSATTR